MYRLSNRSCINFSSFKPERIYETFFFNKLFLLFIKSRRGLGSSRVWSIVRAVGNSLRLIFLRLKPQILFKYKGSLFSFIKWYYIALQRKLNNKNLYYYRKFIRRKWVKKFNKFYKDNVFFFYKSELSPAFLGKSLKKKYLNEGVKVSSFFKNNLGFNYNNGYLSPTKHPIKFLNSSKNLPLFYQKLIPTSILGVVSNEYLVTLLLLNPIVYKLLIGNLGCSANLKSSNLNFYNVVLSKIYKLPNQPTNILPLPTFYSSISKKILDFSVSEKFRLMATQWYYNTVIRFIEFLSGRKVLFQFYPALESEVSFNFLIRYRLWLTRMNYYERKLGHRFFLEESIHIMHLSFYYKDIHIFTSWLRSLIIRISFWRTRLIFRFIKYLFHHYFKYVFEALEIKGLKIKLKGKISAAGNSRKRTILYRTGLTSHSTVNLRVLYDSQLISTFTGVQGLQVWLFY